MEGDDMRRTITHLALSLLALMTCGCPGALESARASEFFAQRDVLLLTLKVPAALEPEEGEDRVPCVALGSDRKQSTSLELDIEEVREVGQPPFLGLARLRFLLSVADTREDERQWDEREPVSVEVLDVEIRELGLAFRRSLDMTFDDERSADGALMSLVGFSDELDELLEAHELGGDGRRVERYDVTIQAKGLTEDGALVLSNEVNVPLEVCSSCDELRVSPLCSW